MLNKGMKYNINSKIDRRAIKNTVVHAKYAIDSLKVPKLEQNKISVAINKIINNEKNRPVPNCVAEKRVVESINMKLNEADAIITKADKGGTLVVLEKKVYIDKTLKFLADNNVEKIDKDLTFEAQRKLLEFLKNCNEVVSPREVQMLKVMNPQAPSLRAQLKVHKDGNPIRPVVDGRSSPFYKVARKCLKFLTTHYKFHKQFSIKNSSELTNRIRNIPINDDMKFVSLDIVNLYTNIPVDNTVQIIQRNLMEQNKLSTREIDEFISLLRIILKYNYFKFNGDIYLQKDGLSMGSSISGLLADIFINHLENRFFSENPTWAAKIIYYFRYVDDTLLLVKGNEDVINSIVAIFNNLHEKIKFTCEVQTNNSINFLDLSIRNSNGRHSFGIFRKKTCTDGILDFTSNHPMQHKKAFFHFAINRVFTIPLSKDEHDHEMTIIEHIATANNYPRNFVNNLYRKIANKYENKVVPSNNSRVPNENTKFVSLPYYGKMSTRIASVFNRYKVKVGFGTTNNLGNILEHTIDKINPIHASGVYKIDCPDCGACYVGQTGRRLETRFAEHIALERKDASERSSMAAHLLETKHKIPSLKNNVKLLHRGAKGRFLDLREDLEIFCHQKTTGRNLLNDQVTLKSAHFWELFENCLCTDKQKFDPGGSR